MQQRHQQVARGPRLLPAATAELGEQQRLLRLRLRWQWMREAHEIRRPGMAYPGIVPLLEAAAAEPRLRGLYGMAHVSGPVRSGSRMTPTSGGTRRSLSRQWTAQQRSAWRPPDSEKPLSYRSRNLSIERKSRLGDRRAVGA
ncbi:DUF6193 family natural product biosynthesis protein [Kitasatospora atroaurantiaca]|uniref:DUF6193 family natural product biosynthesis protein n=1 Tax=Kitasatospora atroaurantiaca TaxID=285545 RepID=UPI003CCC76C7